MRLVRLLFIEVLCSASCAHAPSARESNPNARDTTSGARELTSNASPSTPLPHDPSPRAVAPIEVRHLDADRLCADVRTLADDSWSGRGSGYAGERAATEWIAARFEELGLEPAGDEHDAHKSWFQDFEFHPQAPPVPWQILHSRNVVAFLRGRDEHLAQEIVVLGAHHDGQGRIGEADGDRFGVETAGDDEIWNSADDDGSGVAALLEVARALSHAPLRRSIVFVTFGAEEHALNGAAHYVSHPAFAWDRHVAMIELEKLGRVPGKLPITASAGTSTSWPEAMRAANVATGMEVVSAIEEIIEDADHYPFAAAGLPAIVLGIVHDEDSHRPSDESDRIACTDLARRTEYALALLRALDSIDARPKFASEPRRDAGLLLVNATPAELAARGVPPEQGGAKVSTVLRGLPADRAGFRPGDLVVSIGGQPISKSSSARSVLTDALAASGTTLSVEVIRGSERWKLELAVDR